ncbi:MAG TPA: alpha/beta hydrolase [Solirubrobacteraceae bacterium]|jgi:pimeloyl-ACP methyl ester carboxylesterase|nr:alpha/beta hydrolase [Solirubrobacteraceae bacterium]
MRLRLYHHRDGARVAYREAGTGPPLALVHSALLSHKEWEPVVEHLADRFRVVLPDLPLHGDSEDRPDHPYTPAWFAEVISGFASEVLGPRCLIGGHGLGAEILLGAVAAGSLAPRRLVLMPNGLHRRPERALLRSVWRSTTRLAAVPGTRRLMSHAARTVFRPELGMRLTAREEPAARDVIRHAFADVAGNGRLAHSWARFAGAWPHGAQRELLDAYSRVSAPTLLLWADSDPLHPVIGAEEALDLLPDAQLRILPGTGYLMAYDDPVGLARELAAFCA